MNNSGHDIGSNPFFTPRRLLDEDFIPPLLTTTAELLCGFPGLSGPGGMILGSSPGNLSNFLFPIYSAEGVPFSFLKYWSSGSRIINDEEGERRIYRRQFRSNENAKISFKIRVDPWGYRKWGGHPLTVMTDFGYVRTDIRPYSRRVFGQVELDPEHIIESLTPEIPELIYTLANKKRKIPDPYDQPGDIIPSDFSLSLIVGNPAVAICPLKITELEFCQTLPDIEKGEKIKRRVKYEVENILSAPDIRIKWEAFSEPFNDVADIKEEPNQRDDVFGLEFEIDKSLASNSESLLEVTFLLVVGGRMTTLPDLIYVGKDKTVLKEQESLNVEEKVGPLSWVPQTTIYPIVEGTHPRDITSTVLENRPNKISDFDMFVKKSGRYK